MFFIAFMFRVVKRQHTPQATTAAATAAVVAFPVCSGVLWMEYTDQSLCCVQ